VAESRKIVLQDGPESADGLILTGRTLHVVTQHGVVKVQLTRQLTTAKTVIREIRI